MLTVFIAGDVECAAVLRRGYHLAGGRIEHHFLLGGGCRLLVCRRGPEAGCGQNQDQSDREDPHNLYHEHT